MKTARRSTAEATHLWKRRTWYVDEAPPQPDASVIAPINKTIDEALAKAAELAASRYEQAYKQEQIGKIFEDARASVIQDTTVQIDYLESQIPELENATIGRLSPSTADEAAILKITMDFILARARKMDGPAFVQKWQQMIAVKDLPALRVLQEIHTILEGTDANGKKISLGEFFGVDKLLAQTELMLMSPAQRKAHEKLSSVHATIKGVRALNVRATNVLGARFTIENGEFIDAERAELTRKVRSMA